MPPATPQPKTPSQSPATGQQEQYADQLNQDRAQGSAIPQQPIEQEVPFPTIIFTIALLNDLADWGVLGSIPIAGDFLDVATTGIRWLGRFTGIKKTSDINLLGATVIELIPGGDLVPSYSAEVLITYFQEKAIVKKENEAAQSQYQEDLAMREQQSGFEGQFITYQNMLDEEKE